MPNSFRAWYQIIEDALFEHYAPYAEAVALGELPLDDEPRPSISTPHQVWVHVSFEFVSVTLLNGLLTTEIGLSVAWDQEHTLGARFQAGKFLELNGSVLPP